MKKRKKVTTMLSRSVSQGKDNYPEEASTKQIREGRRAPGAVEKEEHGTPKNGGRSRSMNKEKNGKLTRAVGARV